MCIIQEAADIFRIYLCRFFPPPKSDFIEEFNTQYNKMNKVPSHVEHPEILFKEHA